MVECDHIPYMSLVDWVVYNLRVYLIEVGADEPTMIAVTLMGDWFWDKLLLADMNGKKLVNRLIEECIRDPTIRDEDEWTEYMQCIEQHLLPALKELEPYMKQVLEAMEKGLKNLEAKTE